MGNRRLRDIVEDMLAEIEEELGYPECQEMRITVEFRGAHDGGRTVCTTTTRMVVMSTEYEKGALARTLEYEKGTWREALRARGGLWFLDLPWGFQCHDGWRSLIEDLTDELVEITGGPDHAPGMRVVQIKEKLGTLRYYVWRVPEGFREAIYAAVRRAEERSATVCEVCGRPGQLGQDRGRLHTACPDHRDPKHWRPL